MCCRFKVEIHDGFKIYYMVAGNLDQGVFRICPLFFLVYPIVLRFVSYGKFRV